MKRQLKSYSCGAASARNALKALGLDTSERSLWSLAGMTEDGVDEEGILRVMRAHGVVSTEHRFEDEHEAWQWIHQAIWNGSVILIAIDNWEHWVVVIGSAGYSGVVVFDPSNQSDIIDECGTFIWSYSELMTHWIMNEDESELDGESRIYAISCHRR